MKQQSKVILQIDDKTINAIANTSKETGQFISETLRNEKTNTFKQKKHKNKQKRKSLTLEHFGETLSIQESKHSGHITKLKEPMKRFLTC